MFMEATGEQQPRKQVRLLPRRDLVVVPHVYGGRPSYVVKDPITLRYYRFQEQEYGLFRLLDGSRTLEDAQQEFERHCRPRRMPLEEVEAFARQLVAAGLVRGNGSGAGGRLLDRHRR